MTNNEKLSKALCDTIRKFSENPAGIDNMELYLNRHFELWFKKFVTTPEGLISEMELFSTID